MSANFFYLVQESLSNILVTVLSYKTLKGVFVVRVTAINDGVLFDYSNVKKVIFYPEGTAYLLFLDGSEISVLKNLIHSIDNEVFSQ